MGISATIKAIKNILEKEKSYTITSVLAEDQDLTACCVDVSGDAEMDVYNYDSIIDFSNFLMHALRLYVNKHAVSHHCGVDDVPLNEKELLSVYEQFKDKIDSMEFIKLLLFCRTAFDRFVVKTTSDTADQEDGQRWMLIKPKQYGKSWKYVDSFGVSDKGLVVKAISLLQVTFRSRVYKQWLFETLSWHYDECFSTGDFATISPSRYLGFLHGYMLEYYKKQAFNIPIAGKNDNLTPETTYSKGTDTPHFLLNFIDYLYWCDSGKRAKYELKDFDFKYWNSVEHHLAQNTGGEGCPYIDNLGNLCLVSKSSNSRLSDRDVRQKVQAYGKGNLGPNRQVIYAMTESGDMGEKWTWGECQIRDHYIEVSELLDRREDLLRQCQGECVY